MSNYTHILKRLSASRFRSRFQLSEKEIGYIQSKGLEVIQQHATDFIEQRLAPAFPLKDGKQTPMKGHPVFIAQHATATCCRSCLEKWHHIPSGRTLNKSEKEYIIKLIMTWINQQTAK